MWQLSTKGRYGTRLMFQLALKYGKGPVLLKDIADAEGLTTKYLEHIVPLLKSAKLIRSVRGPHGGYQLTKAPDNINLKDILRILEGNTAPVDCVPLPEMCNRSNSCTARNVWCTLDERISDTLQKITLKDMVVMYEKNFESE
ncbi:MAG: Rrf2 family transcriptional regulator [bacterium]